MIKIIQDPWRYGIEIYVIEENFSKEIKRVLNGDTWVEFKEGEPKPKPTLFLNSYDVKTLVDALSELGIKTDNDHKIQGKLEAVNNHLEDLRTLLKLPSTNDKVYSKLDK